MFLLSLHFQHGNERKNEGETLEQNITFDCLTKYIDCIIALETLFYLKM